VAQTPDQIAARWAAGLAGASQKITDGVNAVSVAPGQAAARQKTVWVQNVAASADKWAANTARVSLSDWQQAMITKGAPRIASGATAAQPKFASFMTQLLPHIASVKGQLPARGNLDQNIARMTAFVRGMSTFKRTG
jgi:hypothetical protein